MRDIRAIENNIRDSFAVLGDDSDRIAAPLQGLPVVGARCAMIKKQRAVILPLTNSVGKNSAQIGGVRLEVVNGLHEFRFDINGNYLIIWCTRFRLREAFNRMIADLLYDLPATYGFSNVKSRLDGWKSLLTGTNDASVEKGLWGELYFLRFLLQNNYGTLDNWIGPFGGTKDFQFETKRAEVKTTTLKRGWSVTLNGLYQLKKQDAISDYLIFIRIESDLSGVSISDLINELNTLLNVDEKAQFDSILAGFPDDVVLSVKKWSDLDSKIFLIDDQMPAIRAENFVSGALPSGVLTLAYSVDLSGQQPFPLHNWNSIT